jgi:cytochrome c5
MNFKYLLSAALIFSASVVSLEAAPRSSDPQSNAAPQARAQGAAHGRKQQPATDQASVHADEGQRIFDQNCTRCHTAPEGFSSRISGTVVRHMRVRASLSQHDEQELLRFLNP